MAESNRYSVARWMDGSTEPRLPDFLRLVQACSRRLVDLVAALEKPEHIPSLTQKKPGKFVWTVFAVSKADLVHIHALHLSYLRAMQELFTSSTGNDCVGLYCAQLLDLGD